MLLQWRQRIRNGHQHYEEEDDRQSVYIGVPAQRGYRRKRRRQRSMSSRNSGDGDRDRSRDQDRDQSRDQDRDRDRSRDQERDRERDRESDRGRGRERDRGRGQEREQDRHYEHNRQDQQGRDERERIRPEDGVLDPHDHSLPPDINRTMSPAAERLRYILGDEDGMPTPTLFTEMDTLQREGEELEWKEFARWVKFEEKVEEGGERWSKPHVSTLSLHSLFELRTCLQAGTVLLDLEGFSLPQIVDDIIERQVEEGLLAPELREKIAYILLRKHRHQTKKPIHRSLADMRRSSGPSLSSPSCSPSTGAAYNRSTEDLRAKQAGSYGRLRHAQSRSMNDITGTPSMDQREHRHEPAAKRGSDVADTSTNI
ncbi:hypothetical protein AAFF_G00177820 [Aldrovandia affinis]|uniref:Band 3 cytoplasmic domain-containing protein n=1 Tax=Aldrovandia affinis TaxID=143900 RepID=A0AAD7W6F4_9TELE|nr:hypothetical protein AAFF_G00177820 [Aldrovandia affinis]